MAITVTARPEDFAASYNPVEYKFTSDRSPNTRTGESVDIQQITPTPADNVVSFNIPAQSVQIITGAVLSNAVRVVGQTLQLSGTEDAKYDGVFTILAISNSPQIFFLDAIPDGDSSGGTAEIFYNNFSVVSDLFVDGSFVIRARARITSDDIFIQDWRSIIQRRLDRDLLDVGAVGTTDASDSTGRMFIKFAEEFDVPVNGIPELTIGIFTDDSDTSANVKTATNAAVPYVFLRNGTIESTATDLTDFLNDGLTAKRFQTNMPKEVTIFENDSAQLTFAIDRSELVGSDVKTRVITFNSAGAIIATDTNIITPDTVDNNFHFACGTANLLAAITSDTVKYEVDVLNEPELGGPDVKIFETITFLIDRTCNRNQLRFHWINPYGNIDSFTFIGRTERTVNVERFVRKRNLASPRVLPESNIVTIQNNRDTFFTANSGGFEDKETAEWLEELIASEEVLQEIDGVYLPVHIDQDSQSINNSRDALFNVGFSWRYGFDHTARRK